MLNSLKIHNYKYQNYICKHTKKQNSKKNTQNFGEKKDKIRRRSLNRTQKDGAAPNQLFF